MKKTVFLVLFLVIMGLMLLPEQKAKAGSLVPEPNTVWITGDGVTASYSPVKDMICWGFNIQGYGTNVVVKFYETSLNPISMTSAGCEITTSVTAAERASWAAAKYGLSFTYAEVGPSPTSTSTLTPSETATSSVTSTQTSTSTSTSTLTRTDTSTPTSTATNTY